MDIVKQYLAQSISSAASNLRLNSQQTEMISHIREILLKSNSVENDLIRMKKITEFSTMAIKLHEMFTYLTKGPLDIGTLSEKFRNHSQMLVKNLNQLLSNPNLKAAIDKLKVNNEERIEVSKPDFEKEGLTGDEGKLVADKDHIKKGSSFQHFEETILKQIKPMDTLLKEIEEGKNLPGNIDEFVEIMEKNSILSKENSFDILSNMHSIVADSLRLIKDGALKTEKNTIEALRSCLIVIAAVVRGKEVNISDYLNKAESFGNSINALKNREEK
jgi:hypothetical protein